MSSKIRIIGLSKHEKISDPQSNLNRLGCVKKNDRNEINSGGSPRLTMPFSITILL